jgi:hypothetical protein
MIRDNRPRYIEREPSFKERLGFGLGSGLAETIAGALRPKEMAAGIERKDYEKLSNLQGGLSTIQRMKQLGETGKLGFLSKYKALFDPGAAQARGEYEQLGKSLISLASTIPIRNQKEFETLSGKLFDPGIRDVEREGILDAMQQIISNSLMAFPELQKPEIKAQKKELKDLDKATAMALLKQAKGDKTLARKLAKDSGYKF